MKTQKFLLGQVIRVSIANLYQKGYGWSDYSESNYIIEKITEKEIIGRNEIYKQDMISITQKDLDCGRFRLKYLD